MRISTPGRSSTSRGSVRGNSVHRYMWVVLGLLLVGMVGGTAPIATGADEPRHPDERPWLDLISQAEQQLTVELQARVDATKRELAERERELSRLRGTLPQEEFEALTAAFDRRVRRERREAQRLSAALQSAFRDQRVKLLGLLDTFLERVRAERGASVILNRDDAVASDPALDVTDQVVVRFDETVSVPEMPDLESVLEKARETSPTQE